MTDGFYPDERKMQHDSSLLQYNWVAEHSVSSRNEDQSGLYVLILERCTVPETPALFLREIVNVYEEVPILAVIIGSLCPGHRTLTLVLSGFDQVFNVIVRSQPAYQHLLVDCQECIGRTLGIVRVFLPGVKLVLESEIGGNMYWGLGEDWVGEPVCKQQKKALREKWRSSYLRCLENGYTPATWYGLQRGKDYTNIKYGDEEYVRECICEFLLGDEASTGKRRFHGSFSAAFVATKLLC
ncbi:hypothetical protein HYALB_00012719 [Hymenoscyphus albidus]|uniref:Uncharacterized protein n=1 Tax=Hymenoscyphus albidus TaxID=595503 RepID=A0A9N9PZN2_9HELO|nr:hypothetical protein HYALB_00012719 [Hymenoscyphus albidus]